jgi:hypothetical protein
MKIKNEVLKIGSVVNEIMVLRLLFENIEGCETLDYCLCSGISTMLNSIISGLIDVQESLIRTDKEVTP